MRGGVPSKSILATLALSVAQRPVFAPGAGFFGLSGAPAPVFAPGGNQITGGRASIRAFTGAMRYNLEIKSGKLKI